MVETSVLIHVVNDSDFNAFLSEASRVLKPDGKILLCGPLARAQSTQIHPYLRYRTIEEHEAALEGFAIENKGTMHVANADYHILTATRALEEI